MIKISSNFDSGNIELLSTKHPHDIQVKMIKDTNSDFMQWFYFRMQGARNKQCRIKITNAGEATYPFWENYNVRASYDRLEWFAVPTMYDGKQLIIDHTPLQNSIYYAYFAPFTYEQHLDLVNTAQLSPKCRLLCIGETIQGRDIDMLIIGKNSTNKKKVWIVARQHPGESMAEWFIQGFIERLLDDDDPIALSLLQKAVFYIVPNMNIDGSIHGNIRANFAGINLNREWHKPALGRSPEVYHVRNLMDQTGVDLNLDIHGDEEIPYVFVTSSRGIPSFNDDLKRLEERFTSKWQEIYPDFQTEYGYPPDAPGEANMSICSNQIAERFQCLSLTLEMPFQDSNLLPDPVYNWSPIRCIKLGNSVLNPMHSIIDEL